jgi:16S rRNA G966 N2-methylase RsmD
MERREYLRIAFFEFCSSLYKEGKRLIDNFKGSGPMCLKKLCFL